jgi:hypothetical protein
MGKSYAHEFVCDASRIFPSLARIQSMTAAARLRARNLAVLQPPGIPIQLRAPIIFRIRIDIFRDHLIRRPLSQNHRIIIFIVSRLHNGCIIRDNKWRRILIGTTRCPLACHADVIPHCAYFSVHAARANVPATLPLTERRADGIARLGRHLICQIASGLVWFSRITLPLWSVSR